MEENVSNIVIAVLSLILVYMIIRMMRQKEEYSNIITKSKEIRKDKKVLLDNIAEFVEEKENDLANMKVESSPDRVSGYQGNLSVYKNMVEDTPNVDKSSFNDFANFRLLIVEDNLINQKILLGVLRDSSMKIDVANHGQEALDFLIKEKREYDVVLMDISMPIMDGEAATKNIREDEAFNNLPIIAFTAFAIGPEIEQMFAVGVNAYMTKPLNVKKLYTVFSLFLTK